MPANQPREILQPKPRESRRSTLNLPSAAKERARDRQKRARGAPAGNSMRSPEPDAKTGFSSASIRTRCGCLANCAGRLRPAPA
jgi:hypothetical protein